MDEELKKAFEPAPVRFIAPGKWGYFSGGKWHDDARSEEDAERLEALGRIALIHKILKEQPCD
jgi:hypothetical protein